MPVHVRRLDVGEEDALVALVRRAADRGELASSSPWLEHGFLPAMVRPIEVAVAIDDGAFAGAVLPELKALLVEPAYRMRGIGSRLVEAGLAIAREMGRRQLFLGVLPGDAPGTAFLGRNGFAFHSSVWDLVLPSAVPARPPVLPTGYVARPFRRDRDVEAFVATFNAAFADHPTPLSIDPRAFSRWAHDPSFRDEDTILVEDADGRIAAFVATDAPDRPKRAVVGRAEIRALGVRPDLQGRGLGRAALLLGVAWLRGHGAAAVGLSVSGHNERALHLYESEGFVREGRRDRWALPTGVAAGTTGEQVAWTAG